MTGGSGSLAGRRVVVTRAAHQADELLGELRDRGAVPVLVPLVATERVPAEADRLAGADPAGFAWLVVTSPNGARAYLEAHRSAPPMVAAVGEATADVLREQDVRVALVPSVQSATGLLAEFPRAPAPPEAGSALLVQAVDAEPAMAEGLAAAGWEVTVITPYRTVPAVPSAAQQLAALSADAVLFASGSSASSWAQVFGTSAPPLVVAIGPRTAAATRGFGLKVDVIATDHSVKGLVDALERHLDPTV